MTWAASGHINGEYWVATDQILIVNYMRILVRLVLNGNFSEIISRFCGNLSSFGCMCVTHIYGRGTHTLLVDRWADNMKNWVKSHIYIKKRVKSYVYMSQFFIYAPWLMYMCDLTLSYVRHDSCICVIWNFYMCAMTHLYVRNDPFICVTWLLHICTWHTGVKSHIYIRHIFDMTPIWYQSSIFAHAAYSNRSYLKK